MAKDSRCIILEAPEEAVAIAMAMAAAAVVAPARATVDSGPTKG
jgi:hypothetical protein